jgi:hypothetical protein
MPPCKIDPSVLAQKYETLLTRFSGSAATTCKSLMQRSGTSRTPENSRLANPGDANCLALALDLH